MVDVDVTPDDLLLNSLTVVNITDISSVIIAVNGNFVSVPLRIPEIEIGLTLPKREDY